MSGLPLDQLSILLIEPSHTQRRIICGQLEKVGAKNVETASSPEDCWDVMQQFVPDLVITPMYFEHFTAAELLMRMRADDLLKEVSFVLISSEERWDTLEPIKQAGVIAILPKPFATNDLEMALNAASEFVSNAEDKLCYDPEIVKTLVVDDSITSRKHVERLLRSMGFSDIELASNGKEAVELLNESVFDLVITDYNMPEMDGAMLVSHIRNHSFQKEIPIIIVTSETDEARLKSVSVSGVTAICDKPFHAGEVNALINSVLE
jgi:two-component system chemotaxis response regulator CheY